jgi:hypothetical protein
LLISVRDQIENQDKFPVILPTHMSEAVWQSPFLISGTVTLSILNEEEEIKTD